MNKIDRLTNEHPELSVNLISLLRNFDPSDSGKFLPFLIKRCVEAIQARNEEYQMDSESTQIINVLAPEANPIEKQLLYYLFMILDRNKLSVLWEFNNHLNAKRIEENDVTKYKSWADIYNGVMLAEMKIKEKELQKQVQILFDNGEWLILKPLSFKASLTYGSGTKWCTTSRTNPNYFYQYCARGTLVYIINRKTNYKFAMFVEKNKAKPFKTNYMFDISFWDAEDNKIESMALDAPNEIMDILRQHINDRTQLKPNKYFFDQDELKHYRLEIKKEPVDAIIEVPFVEENRPPIEDRPYDGEPDNNDEIAIGRVLDEHEEQLGMDGNVALDALDALEAIEVRLIGREEIVMGDVINNGEDECVKLPLVKRSLKNESKEIEYNLAPGIEPIEISRNFIPAPWLTQAEINIIETILHQRRDERYDTYLTQYSVYPNGRIIQVYDTIRANTIIERSITELRVGRNSGEPFNPFTIMQGEVNLSTDANILPPIVADMIMVNEMADAPAPMAMAGRG